MKKHITHTLALFIGLIGLVLTAQAEDSKIITRFKDGFSGEQGKGGWSYEYILKDGSYKKIETVEAEKKVWKGPEGWHEVGAIALLNLTPGRQNDVALTWTSPSDGKLYLGLGNIRARGDTEDGVQICVKLNDEVVWPTAGGFHLFKAKDETVKPEALKLKVKAGDTLRFIVNRVNHHRGDQVFWNPYISLTPQGKQENK
jgi:hypothetical protein